MDDMRAGAAFRAVRMRRGWRQQDVAARAGVSRAYVSLIERGHIGSSSLGTLRAVASALDIRVDVVPRWRGGELERLLNARHSALHESVARRLAAVPGWSMAPEVSFSVYGERGVIDVLAFHVPTGSLLVIELKTAVVDVNELIGTFDRKRRLAIGIARERGWQPADTSGWLIVERTRTNQRRLREHRHVLAAAFPTPAHAVGGWLRDPGEPIAAISTWLSHRVV